jgi:hypothetical protein
MHGRPPILFPSPSDYLSTRLELVPRDRLASFALRRRVRIRDLAFGTPAKPGSAPPAAALKKLWRFPCLRVGIPCTLRDKLVNSMPAARAPGLTRSVYPLPRRRVTSSGCHRHRSGGPRRLPRCWRQSAKPSDAPTPSCPPELKRRDLKQLRFLPTDARPSSS